MGDPIGVNNITNSICTRHQHPAYVGQPGISATRRGIVPCRTELRDPRHHAGTKSRNAGDAFGGVSWAHAPPGST